MKHLFLISITITILSFNSPFVQAYEADDDNTIGYDSIVRELKSTSTYREPIAPSDPFSEILFHGSMGYTSSYVIIDPEYGNKMHGVLKGVEFTLGIDLLSKYWLAEMSIRSFQPEDLSPQTQISLREFDLKIIYHDDLSRSMSYRLGAGLSSRYLKFKSRVSEEVVKDRYTTPSSILTGGIQVHISKIISIGPDLAYRTALIDDTVDKQSFDANIKLNAQF